MTSRVKAVFFDLGETLVTLNIEDTIVNRKALQELSEILPQHVPGDKLYRIYQSGYKLNDAVRSAYKVEIPVQVWMRELLQKALGKEPPDSLVDRAIKIIVRNRAANSVALKDARPTLERLAKHRVKLGVISNVSSHEVALEILKHVKLQSFFDHVVTSAQTGIRKPDPAIFLYALSQMGVSPEQAVHVGDSERHDVWGAKPVGITTVLIDNGTGRSRTDADYQFRSLGEAANLLESLIAK